MVYKKASNNLNISKTGKYPIKQLYNQGKTIVKGWNSFWADKWRYNYLSYFDRIASNTIQRFKIPLEFVLIVCK